MIDQHEIFTDAVEVVPNEHVLYLFTKPKCLALEIIGKTSSGNSIVVFRYYALHKSEAEQWLHNFKVLTRPALNTDTLSTGLDIRRNWRRTRRLTPSLD